MKKSPQILAILVLFLVLFAGLLVFAMGAAEFATTRMIVDQFSRDGSMDSFTLRRYQVLRIPLLLAGLGSLLMGGLGLVFFSRTERLMHWAQLKARRYWKQFRRDLKNLWIDATHPGFAWWEGLVVVLLILLAFAGRWVWVERPMMHDESYTFIAFAQRPLDKVIGDYHLPNNHVLNTILIHLLYSLFGNPSPIIVRLPSLLAGVLCVPLAYRWARKQYGKPSALVAAGLIAYFPWLKLQSTNGRGYLLMAMFTLLMLILADRVRKKKDRAAWGLLTLVTVLNFYTLPIALYPFGIIGLWLLVSGIRGDIAQEYGGFWRFFRSLFGYGVFSGMLTLLLYSPIFLFGSGWQSFFNNPFVASLDWNAFVQTLPIRLGETLQEWQLDVPVWVSIFLVVGMILSVIFHRYSKSGKISLQACAVAALTLIFIVQRPNPWTRIWTFLLPVLLVWASAGWFLMIEHFTRNEKERKLLSRVALGICMAAILVLSVTHIQGNLQYFEGELGQEETVTLALQEIVTADDVVLTSVGFGPAFWYYFDLHHLPMETIVNPVIENGWQRVYFVVDDREDQSPVSLFRGKALSPEDCPSEILQKISEYGHYRVYLCSRESGWTYPCMQD